MLSHTLIGSICDLPELQDLSFWSTQCQLLKCQNADSFLKHLAYFSALFLEFEKKLWNLQFLYMTTIHISSSYVWPEQKR